MLSIATQTTTMWHLNAILGSSVYVGLISYSEEICFSSTKMSLNLGQSSNSLF